jgi:hypothetical protein
MLKDLPEDWADAIDWFMLRLREITSGSPDTKAQRVHRGIYLAHLNFENELRPVAHGGLVVDGWPEFDPPDGDHDMTWFSSYGVVDHWTQLPLDLLDKDKRNLLVYLSRHRKEEQPEEGGWRWHKWGPYIGVFQEQARAHEYLYYTPDVIEVYSYRILEVK